MTESALAPGTALHEGRFVVRGVLGQGAMGVVYRVHDRELGRDVALKALERVDPDSLYRLKHEFRSAAEILHPNLVRLHELFDMPAGCFFTMDVVIGEDLLTAVRGGLAPGDPLDVAATARLRHAFAGLVDGLAALHAGGHVHRDVKPSNAIVEAETGRTVLMDFGLSVERARGSPAEGSAFAGTFEYAAPEQTWGAPPDPSLDVYALGVTLREVLTGELPFAGSVAEMLHAKESGRFEPVAGRLPPELEHLAPLLDRMLAPDPGARPGLGEIDRALRGAGDRRSAAPGRAPRDATGRPSFVGRRDELCALDAALDAARAGASAVVEVMGPAGIGKSALLEEWTGRVAGQGAWVLRSRCRRRESISYRAVDGIIDDLSGRLLSLEPAALERVLPPDPESLVRLFPVLDRVPGMRPRGEARPASAAELRRRGFASLRALLGRLAEERTVVLWIDDAQWGDGESAQLLRAVLQAPAEPAVLVAVSHRSEGEGPLVDWLRSVVPTPGPNARVELGALPARECALLVERLVEADAAESLDAAAVDDLVKEAQGYPFFLGELLRLRSGQVTAGERISDLGTVVRERLSAVSEEGRRVVEVMALAGHPLSMASLAGLFDDVGSLRLLVDELCMRSLLRSFVRSEQEIFEPFHDCISDAVRSDVGAEHRRETHRRIAEALVASGDATPELLVGHYVAADDTPGALREATSAARRADAALAFEQAAELYALAARLTDDDASRAELGLARGQALANAGDPTNAAAAFLEAAETWGKIPGQAQRQAAAKGHAARQLLFAGRLADGVRALNESAGLLGIEIPDDPKRIARRALWMRLKYVMRRLPPPTRPAASVPPEEVERLDILLGASHGTVFLDPALNDLLTLHHAFEAFRSGEVGHVCSGIAKEAGIEGAIGGAFWRRRADRLLDVAHGLADQATTLHRAHVRVIRGGNYWFRAEWRKCVEWCEEALALYEQCAGTEWEIGTTYTFLLGGLAQLGDLRAVRRHLEPLVQSALAATSELITANLYHTSEMVLVPLADDDPGEARRACDRVIGPYEDKTFSSQHYHYLIAVLKIELYRGDSEAAWQRVQSSWADARASGLFGLEGVRIQLHMIRAMCALARLADAPEQARALERVALSDARTIARAQIPNAAPLAAAIRAGVALARGERRRGIALLRRAESGFDAAEMALCAHATRLHLARLGAGDATASEAWMHEQGIVRPDRLARVVAPGFLLGGAA